MISQLCTIPITFYCFSRSGKTFDTQSRCGVTFYLHILRQTLHVDIKLNEKKRIYTSLDMIMFNFRREWRASTGEFLIGKIFVPHNENIYFGIDLIYSFFFFFRKARLVLSFQSFNTDSIHDYQLSRCKMI